MFQDDTLPDYGTKSEDPVQEKTFVIFGSNGNWIIEKVLRDMGMKPLPDKFAQNFMIKWVESRLSVKYETFREEEQLINRIPNCYMLTNKLGLLVNLHKFQAACKNGEFADIPNFNISDFFPETYRIDDERDRKFFIQRFKPGEVWISKPIGLNQGRGIYLVRDIEQYKEPIKDVDKDVNGCRLIQKYITNPLLMDGKKFDIRVYMLIASTKPYLVLFRKGYIRLSLHKYNLTSEDITIHLTNQFIQRKSIFYDTCKNETICSYDKFNTYINKYVAPDKKLEHDWAHKTLWNRMKDIASLTFMSVKDKFTTKVGYFDLYGLDFLVDEDLKIWLLEVNVNPCLSTNCDHLRTLIPDVINETLHVVMECFKNCQQRKPLLPLESQRQFEMLFYDGPIKNSAFGFPIPLVQKNQLIPPTVQTTPTQQSANNANLQPKKNIISVVFHPEKNAQKDTKSMFETNKKALNQEKKPSKSEDNYDGDDEFELENIQNKKDEENQNFELFRTIVQAATSINKDDRKIINPEPIKETPKPQNIEVPAEANLKSIKETAKMDETSAIKTKPNLTAKELEVKDETKISASKEITFDIQTDLMSASRSSSLITNVPRKRELPKESRSVNFDDSIEGQPDGKNIDVGKSMNTNFGMMPKDSNRLPRIRPHFKEMDVKSFRSPTVSRFLRSRLHGNSISQSARSGQPGTDFIAANKLLVQTLAKMNAEKRVKNLQSKFYSSSLSPTMATYYNKRRDNIHQNEG